MSAPAKERRLALLYFSGAGGTRLVAELLGELLEDRLEPVVASIEDPLSLGIAAASDMLVLLYPTYYLKPAPSMREFARALGPFDPPKPAYLVTTCELYTENSIRRMALALKERGLAVAGSKVVHAPGSDVTFALPSGLIPWWYRFERALPSKLRAMAEEIGAIAGTGEVLERIPGPKWYTPLTALAQFLLLDRFDAFRGRVRAIDGRCESCGACVGLCGRGAWSMGPSGPVHDPERCELCGRCMHRCPRNAIVILGALKDNRRLDSRLYEELGREARDALGLGPRRAAAAGRRSHVD